MAGKKEKKTTTGSFWTYTKNVLVFIRPLWVPVACLVALFIGMAIGYVTLGHQRMDDVWKMETWRHIYDLVFAP